MVKTNGIKDFDSCFCYQQGYGWFLEEAYLKGTTQDGLPYGDKVYFNDTVTMYVDTIEGSVSYKLNNKYYSTAFDEGSPFRSGELLAAVSVASDQVTVELVEAVSLLTFDL